MRVHLSADAPFVHATEKLRQVLTSLLTGFESALCEWAYRPEQHYMRGPGPKCRKVTRMAEPRRVLCPRACTPAKCVDGQLDVPHPGPSESSGGRGSPFQSPHDRRVADVIVVGDGT